jgi:hypothetical protein
MRLFLSALSCLVFVQTVSAVDVTVAIPTEHKPTKVVGLVISKDGVLEKTGIEVGETTNNHVTAIIPVAWAEGSDDSLVTTIYITEQGEIKFSALKSIATQKRDEKSAEKAKCVLPAPKANDHRLLNNLGALNSLVDVRKAKRDVTKLEISNKLKGDFLKKLQNLESGFGLTTEVPLSADIPPAELNIRLFRILTALKAYKNAN